MNYSEFTDQKAKYDDILETRLDRYCAIMKTKKTKYNNNDYENYESRDQYDDNIEYQSYGIDIRYERTWSGCGMESYSFTVGVDILEMDEEKYFLKIQYQINQENIEFDLNKKLEDEAQVAIKLDTKRKKDLATLARLQKEYGNEK